MGKTEGEKDCALVLHDIRSVHNTGSIFRTADAVGVSKIYLTGYTPAPVDRFGRARKDFAKVSLGAEKSVVWEKREDIRLLLVELKRTGYQIVAVEQSPRAVDYKTVSLSERSVIILGNEIEGIAGDILAQTDIVAEIPMHGEKESLNVSVSAGIALFRMLNR